MMHAILKNNILVSLIKNDDILDTYDLFDEYVIEQTSLDFDNTKDKYLSKSQNKIKVIIKEKIGNSYFFGHETIKEKTDSIYYLIRSELDIESSISLFTSKKNLHNIINK
jgi:hypothetical protein